MVIKKSFRCSPKKYLESTMIDYPGGTWLVFEVKTHKKVELLCIGYKYNCKNLITFVATQGVGSTLAGKPYQAKYNEIYGNVIIRYIGRPKIVLTYFDNINCVGAHNQCHQGLLGIERCWTTQNRYFRIFTTLIGMEVTDTWYLTEQGSND